jgi:hypothetical protein
MKITTKDKKAIEEFRKKVEFIHSNTSLNLYETEQDKEARKKRTRKDIKFMVEYYFSHIADSECGDFQVQIAKKVIRNFLFKGFLEWPRGHAKSIWATLFIPFWLYINGHTNYMVIVSNCETAAADLSDDLRAELEGNQKIINDFGVQKVPGKKWEYGFFITNGGLIVRALGIGQKIRGLRVGKQRPDLCVVDDIETEEINQNPKRQDNYATWIEKSLLPTMTGKYRRLLWSNNRWAPRMIQTVLQERHPNWYVHHIKAYDPVTLEPIAWPQMYPKEYWEAQVLDLGPLACQAEYNQEPHVEGKIFTDDLIRWDKIPRLDHMDHVLAYWDVAYSGKNDFNAVKVWGRKGEYFYKIKAFVRQCKMADAIEWMFLYSSLLPQSVHLNFYYESQFWNDALEMTYAEVAGKFGFDIPLIKDDRKKGNKYDRMVGTLPYYQQGRIIYNQKEKSSNDMQIGLAQLKGIEPGYKSHDDSPDADEGALFKLNRLFVPNNVSSQVSYGNPRRTGRY